MNVDYGDILTRAARIVWNNKGLWVLGILAGLISGGGYSGGSSGGGGGGGGNGGGAGPGPDFGPGDFPGVERFFEQNGAMFIGIALGVVCLVLLLGLVFMVLGFIGRGGLIGGTRLALANNNRVTFAEAWGEGTRHLGRVFSLWLFTGLPMLIIGLLFAAVALFFAFQFVSGAMGNVDFNDASLGGGIILMIVCLVGLACLLVPVGIALQILNHMGTLAAVSEERSGLDALQRGWAVLRGNIGPVVIMGALFIGLNIAYAFVVGIPTALVLIPVILFAGAGVGLGAANDLPALAGGGIILALACCAVLVPILLVVRGIFEAWTFSAWTLLYDKLTRPAPSAPPAPALNPAEA